MASPIIYLIRHGEKPPKDADGEDQPGLSTLGLDRSQALVQVFGPSSPYNIGYIIAQKPKEDGNEARPYDTVKPLAASLGDGVTFNYDIKRDRADKVASAAHKYHGPGNVLICWEHHHLTDIATAIGISNAPTYPDDRFDLIWTVESPYDQISNVTSEQCPGLDDKYKDDVWIQNGGQWVDK